VQATLSDLVDVSQLPNLTKELLRRGYSESDIEKILGGNMLRVMAEQQ
jgi:membrane dipeptidase